MITIKKLLLINIKNINNTNFVKIYSKSKFKRYFKKNFICDNVMYLYIIIIYFKLNNMINYLLILF